MVRAELITPGARDPQTETRPRRGGGVVVALERVNDDEGRINDDGREELTHDRG